MLSRETVFVLGAGASFELGLPLGEELRTQIAKLVDIRYEHFSAISGDDQINHYLREIAKEREYRDINGLLKKCWLMRDALPASISIDNLIDAHRNDLEFAEIAKIFLGFAFHPLNMEILTGKNASLADRVLGTTVGLSDAAVRSVENSVLQTLRKRAPADISPLPELGENLSELSLEPRSAADFLQAYFRSIA